MQIYYALKVFTVHTDRIILQDKFVAFWSFKPSLICFAFFLFFACNRTNQTIGSGNKHARRSKHTSVLNVQWYGNSEIILFYFRHTAGRCFGSISFSASSDVVPTLQTRAQAAPLTSWNMHESDRDTASAPGWNREILPAAGVSWELDEPRISVTV